MARLRLEGPSFKGKIFTRAVGDLSQSVTTGFFFEGFAIEAPGPSLDLERPRAHDGPGRSSCTDRRLCNERLSFASLTQVTRTGHGGFIPVYRDIRNGGTRVVTVVRKVSGDLEASKLACLLLCHAARWDVRGLVII